jgi:hypothetical protein
VNLRRRGGVPVTVTAVASALAIGAGATLAIHQLVTPPDAPSVTELVAAAALSTATQEVVDARGDADLPVGDIVSSSLTASPDGTMTVVVVVDEWTDPASDDWLFGETGARWQLDVDSDDVAEARVQLDVDNGVLRGGVVGAAGRVRCIGETSSDQAARSYSVRFRSTCIGNPQQLRFLAQFAYDDVVFDIVSFDAGPGWSPAVVNPAFVEPPPSSTAPPSTPAPTTPPTTPPPTPPPTPPTVVPTPAGSPVVSLSPARLLDSRSGSATVDGLFQGLGVRPGGSVTEVQVTGRGGVPVDASAVVLNVTLVLAQGDGFATVFPCGGPVPNASNLNYVSGGVVANAVVAKVGVGGKVCVFTFAASHLLVDVNGYVPAGSDVNSLSPARLLDSRSGSATVDGLFQGLGVRPGGSVTEVQVTGRGGVPVDASAVVLNVTLVLAQGDGFATVFPCGGPVPNASNLNYVSGGVVANAVVAKVGVGGKVCVFTFAASHLLVDVNGYVPAGSDVNSLSPARLLDSRSGSATVDGLFQGLGVRPGGSVTEVQVTGRGGVPVDASAVVLNVTLVLAQGDGFATVFPCGGPVPNASNLNYVSGGVVANAVVAKVGVGGKVCVFTFAASHLLVDVNGYIP